MELLAHLLRTDPAAPRLTVYNESTGARLDFSAQTLDNWASKVGNMLLEELDLEEGSTILIDLPVSWQAVTIALGALAAGVTYRIAPDSDEVDAIFTSPGRFDAHSDLHSGADIVLVTEDPFGRGVVECGDQLPAGAIDFGPTVRFYGDQFFGPAPALVDVVTSPGQAHRVLSTGWHDHASLTSSVLQPLAAGGSAVVVAGIVGPERLDEIATEEKVSARI